MNPLWVKELAPSINHILDWLKDEPKYKEAVIAVALSKGLRLELVEES